MRAEWRALTLLALFSFRVFAQGVDPGLPPVANPPLEEAAPAEPSWSERCFARSAPGWYGVAFWPVRPLVVVNVGPGQPVHGAVPARPGGEVGVPGGKGGEVLLVALAVVAAAVLPFILLAVDEEATPDVLGRFFCPGVDLDLRGGVEFDRGGGPSAPLGVRLRATAGHFGVMAQFDLAPWSERSLLDTRLAALIRFTPRQHVEVGLSLGYRSQVLRDTWRPGFEVALPHEYVFWRDGAAQVGLEVRPSLFWWGGVDLALDLGLRIPLGPFVSLYGGGRVFTLDGLGSAGIGAQGGLAFKL